MAENSPAHGGRSDRADVDPTGAELSDAELLAAIERGDDGAFDAFVERYGRRLFAFGVQMCGHHEDAEDVFQETLLRAYRSLRSVRDPGAVRTWLYRVVANQCLMMRRKEKPERSLPLDEAELDRGLGTEGADISPGLLRAAELPEDAAARSELRQELDAALRSLPKTLRIVLLLREMEGFSTKETAEVLGLGTSAVKMRLSRAREHLREALQAPDRAT